MSLQTSDCSLDLSQCSVGAIDLLLDHRVQQRESGFAVSLVYRGEHGIHKVSLARRALPTRASSVHVGRAQPVAFGGLVRRDLGTANRFAKLDVAWPLLDRRR